MAQEPGNHFSLRWNDYKSSLVDAFESLRTDDDFVDVTLGCGGRKFKAHKLLLSACSSYFRELLRGNPCQHPIIIVRETLPSDLEAILEFIYNGEVNVEENQLDSFLKAAGALQIKVYMLFEYSLFDIRKRCIRNYSTRFFRISNSNFPVF